MSFVNTYRFPVFNPAGLRLTAFKNAKAYSIAALEYEYGADMHIRKPRDLMCWIEALQVW